MAALNRSPLVARQRQQAQPKPRPMDPQIYTPVDENDRTLMFESRFESGNLYLAQKVADTEYNLLMQNDVNTNGHTQWFFFRVQNTRAGQRVKFNLLNYTKPDSLFNYGMKVTIYSERAAEEKKVGWFKGGEDISYFQNGIRKDVLYSSKSFYTATFTHKFKYSGDSVYFAYSQPYTYTAFMPNLTRHPLRVSDHHLQAEGYGGPRNKPAQGRHHFGESPSRRDGWLPHDERCTRLSYGPPQPGGITAA
jgi:hypothetical protein